MWRSVIDMSICICDITELECLRAMSAPGGCGVRQSGDSQLAAPTAAGIGPACWAHVRALGSTAKTLHVVVPSAKDRLSVANVACHVLTEAETPESFIDFGAGIVGLSIEHFYVSMCCRLTFEQQLLLAYELCGWYSIVPNPNYEEEVEKGERAYRTHAVERAPLTTVSKLRRFADNNRHIRGSKIALRALRYVADCARSPEEARLAIVLLLPHRMGGYNCGPLVMDYRVDGAGRYRRCDIFLLLGKIDIEYNGNRHHFTPADVREDSKRANALAALGISVVGVTYEELRDPSLFHNVMLHVSRLQGRRLRIRTSGFADRRAQLWKALFG